MSPAIRKLLPYVNRYRRAFVLGFVCVVSTTTFQLLGPWVLKYAIDDLYRGVTQRKLILYAGLLVGVSLVRGLFLFLMRRIIIAASRDIEYDIRNDFFRRLEQQPLGYYQARRTGDLMSRATNDLNAVRMMIGPAVMYSASTILVFLVAIVLMVSIDLRLTLIALIPLPFVTISVRYFGTAIHKRFEQIQAQLSEVSAVVQEALSGVRVVRAYRQEPYELARFRDANAEYVRRNTGLIALQAMYFPSMGLLMGIGALLVLWLGSREVVRGRITIGELVAFNAYLAMLAWPMIAFGWVTNLWQRGMASWKRMLEVLDVEPGVSDAQARPDAVPAAIKGDVEFRHLTFGFGGEPVLRDVSIVIPAGTTTAIVGGIGAGKSVLLSLLARLHEPPPDTVFIDGHDVRQLPLSMVRGAIGFAPQDLFLFSATIADNIALAEPASTADVPAWPRERIETAAGTARLDADLPSFPQGYDTMVGERGITLSGGQKQRTALARALAADPRVLVLDDTLSAVDTHTEEEILTRLRGVRRERTSILVSHRVSTVRDADQILVLDGGRVVERGTHDELLRLGGQYAALARHQQLEDELAAIG